MRITESNRNLTAKTTTALELIAIELNDAGQFFIRKFNLSNQMFLQALCV